MPSIPINGPLSSIKDSLDGGTTLSEDLERMKAAVKDNPKLKQEFEKVKSSIENLREQLGEIIFAKYFKVDPQLLKHEANLYQGLCQQAQNSMSSIVNDSYKHKPIGNPVFEKQIHSLMTEHSTALGSPSVGELLVQEHLNRSYERDGQAQALKADSQEAFDKEFGIVPYKPS